MTAPPTAPSGRLRIRVGGGLIALTLAALGLWAWPADAPTPEAQAPPGEVSRPDAGRNPTAAPRILRGWVADERGLPVVSAVVTLLTSGAQERTDHAGAFELQAPGKAPIDLEFSAEHHSTVVAREVRDSAGLHIVLERSATISGTVSDGDGSPVAEALVEIAGTGLWPSRTTPSGADGSYRFDGLPGGLYALRGATETQVALLETPAEVDPGAGTRVDLVLQQGAPLQGRVVDAATGKPIEHAEVSVGEPDSYLPPLLLATDAEGQFLATPLPRQAHRVSTAAPGFVSQLGVEATPGKRVKVLRLRRAAVLAGRVLDARGRPVVAAQLEVVGRSRGRPMVLSATGLQAPVSPLVGGQPAALPLMPGDNLGVVPGPVPPIPIFATAPALPGTAPTPGRGALGSPVPAPGEAPSPPGFHTDAEGRFRIGGIPGGKLRLFARSALHASAATPTITLRAGELREDLELVLPDGFDVRGRVVDADGEAVAGTRIGLDSAADPMPRTTVTDGEGRFTLRRLVGECTLRAHPPGHPAEERVLSVGEGGVDVEIQLSSRSHFARGRVFDPRGIPLEGALVTLDQGADGASFRLGVATGPDGTFEAPGLPPPPYRLRVTRRGYAPELVTYSDEHGEELRIKMAPGHSLRVRTVDTGAREVIANVPVKYAHAAGNAAGSLRTGSTGTAEVSDLSAGKYTISVDHPPYLVARTEATVGIGDEPVSIDLVPAGSASGDVVDSLGAPVYDAQVTSADHPDWGKAARTDHAGHFVVERLPPGEARLTARHPGAGTVILERPIDVRPRQDSPGVVLRLPERAPDVGPVQRGGGSKQGPREGVQATVEMRSGKITVTRVAFATGAQHGGLRVGDIVVEVEGERVFAAGQVRSMWLGDAGSRVAVGVQRGGKLRHLRLMRDRPPH